jgi:hypothetical protein
MAEGKEGPIFSARETIFSARETINVDKLVYAICPKRPCSTAGEI